MTSEKIKGSSRPYARCAPVASRQSYSPVRWHATCLTFYSLLRVCYMLPPFVTTSQQDRRSFWLARCSITALKVVSWFRSSLAFSFSSSKPCHHPAWGWRVSISSRVKANLIPIGPYYSRRGPSSGTILVVIARQSPAGSFVPFPLLVFLAKSILAAQNCHADEKQF